MTGPNRRVWRRRIVAALLLVLPLTAQTVLCASPVAAATGTPRVMVIVEENQGYAQVIGNKAAPYITSLANTYASATNWYGLTDISLTDYVALISGTKNSYSAPTLVDKFAAASNPISWKAYMEDAPSPCYLGGRVGNYTKTHNPFVHFPSITGNPAQCDQVVPFSGNFNHDFGAGSGSAPSFAFVVPNLCHDMHDSCAPQHNPVAQGDQWLKATMSTVLASQWYAGGGIVIITWDAALTSDHSGWNTGSGGHVPTIVVSATSHGAFSSGGNEYGTLRGICETYGITPIGQAASAANGDLRPAF
ncbi:MAG: hypothetical protein M3R48_05905 [Candidatus Dormibacteraeota bacterium]|nr:hypothetical protein [Candidatus Dormibacteraeota bacterium]